ncbi:transcription factor bHLH94-like [Olea europaea subsp. europaea]|uniref:Transcription factor bHLH94-like n=1 Tax=Olea europaea subsp. europaea TaxID=158383 RepID=A0A8S0UTV4_OLEEU|nr:transcription factor bHLH94-like [Olea europaea subsp. europaea]
MALEAVIFQQDLFGQSSKDLYSLYNLVEGKWDFEPDPIQIAEETSFVSVENNLNYVLPHHQVMQQDAKEEFANTVSVRGKRRRSRIKKNVEEIETQRMTHIATERNRRKQMNDYLSVLRALMPDSYVQKGDQASIVGGAINYVKELEQQLQLMGGLKKYSKENLETETSSSSSSSPSHPFGEFFTCPQYSTTAMAMAMADGMEIAKADIEVTMVESHANVKIRSKKHPKRLLKIVSGLQNLRLNILHLNVTTVNQVVLYSLSVKVEDGCNLTSVDEIAAAVNQLLS